jgi:hypothetical protein
VEIARLFMAIRVYTSTDSFGSERRFASNHYSVRF